LIKYEQKKITAPFVKFQGTVFLSLSYTVKGEYLLNEGKWGNERWGTIG
jgi:hypothetical protein